MSVTPNKNLQLPAFNTPNWDAISNGNFSLLDNDIGEVAKFDAIGQVAAITAQPLFTPVAAGLFRISCYAVVTQAATTSSSLNVSVTYTDSDTGVVTTLVGTAQTGNTVGALVQATFIVSSVNAVQIQGNTTYASVGGTVMKYAVHFRVEQLN